MENYKTASTKRDGGRLRVVPTKRFCVLDRWSLTRGGCAWRFDMNKGQKTTRKFPPTSRTFFYIPRNRAVRLLAVLNKLIPRLFSLSSSRLSSSGAACSRKAAFRRWGASWIVRGENKLGKNEGKLGLGLGLGTVPSLASPGFFLRALLLSTWNRLSQESILDFEAHT